MSDYNGWTNYETWNVALWIGNDEGLYNIARRCSSYDRLVKKLAEIGFIQTPDGVDLKDTALDLNELDEFLEEL